MNNHRTPQGEYRETVTVAGLIATVLAIIAFNMLVLMVIG